MAVMDSFTEQIVAKKSETRDNVKRLLIALGGGFACALFVFIGFLLLQIGVGMIFLMLAFLSVWATKILLQNTAIEYEYIVTNDEMDIDKILGRRKRKRLITIKISKAEAWGLYTDDAAAKTASAAVTVEAHDCSYNNLWYMIAHHEKHGKTVVLFSPGNNVLAAINKKVPHSLRKKEVGKKHDDIFEEGGENGENEEN
ncbi:MAG: hypothetical protein FWH20_01995 [Oscillospiraceae bacterium]|nr:hypothetical protein [Oscillospiraceae bacterium]